MDYLPPPSKRPLIIVAIAVVAGVVFTLLHLGFVIRIAIVLGLVAAFMAWRAGRG